MQLAHYFEGLWIIDTTQNQYEVGIAPKEGSYRITILENDTIRFDMEWVDKDDKSHQMTYYCQVDGKMHAYENTAIADFLKTEMPNETTMITSSFKDGTLISKGTRKLRNDYKTMYITQESYDKSGMIFSNHSVYQKKEE